MLLDGRRAGVAVDLGRAAHADAGQSRGLLGLKTVADRTRVLEFGAQNGAKIILVHGVNQHAEGTEGLRLVLDERIALAEAAQADALLEVVHLLQVAHPARVDHAQHDLTVELAHEVGAQTLGLGVVHVLHKVENLLAQSVVGRIFERGGVRASGELDDPLMQTLEIALAIMGVDGAELRHTAVDGVANDLVDMIGEVLAIQDLVALGVNDLTLLVHDVVILENVLTHGEVDVLDLALGTLDGLGNHLVLDGHVVAHLGGDHEVGDLLHALAAEHTHEVVLERKVELSLTRVALTAGAAAKLVVDTTRFVALGANDSQTASRDNAIVLGTAHGGHLVADLLALEGDIGELLGGDVDAEFLQAGEHEREALTLGGLAHALGTALDAIHELPVRLAQDALDNRGVHAKVEAHELLDGHLLGIATEQDVRTTAGHVGGDGHGAQATGLSDDLSLALMELGVQDLVLDAALVEQARQTLGALDGHGAHQDGLTGSMALLDLIGDRVELGVDGAVHQVVVIDAGDGAVGGDDLNGQVVDLAELGVLGDGRTGHAGELVVEAEVVLQGDGGQRLVLLADQHALFGLDGLMQSLGVTTALHDAAGELIDDLDLAVGHHVLLVAVEHVLGFERLLQMVDEGAGQIAVDIFDAEALLDLLQALLGGGDGVLGLVHDEVTGGLDRLAGKHVEIGLLALSEAADGAGEVLVGAGALGAGTGDDEGRARLIDQDGVNLVDDGECVAALNALTGAQNHVVTQVVETELGVGAVCDIGIVSAALLIERHAILQQTDLELEEAVDMAHPLGVALGEIVVDGDDMDALTGECVEIAGKRGDEGLALARLHLGNHTVMQSHSTDELHVEVAQAERAARGLTHNGESIGQQVVEGLPRCEALTQDPRLILELLGVHGLVLGLETVNGIDGLPITLQVLVGAEGEQLRNESHLVSSSR